jgi:hypothetical protein
MQPEFDFTPRPPQAVASADIDRLCDYLRDHAGWITARQLAEALGFKDRKLRQLAEHSQGRIVSGPGCPGYRHLDHCTIEQLDHVAHQLESQGKAMIARALNLRRKAHQRIH